MSDAAQTPERRRPQRPFFPRNAARLPLLSAAVAALALFGAGFAYMTGWTSLASPGPVLGGHAAFETSCAQCHRPDRGTSDLRCERCHDPIGDGQFSLAAHVMTGGDDPWKAEHASTMACASCHVDHQGRNVDVAAMDRQCQTCHAFRSFASHPEFARVRSGAAANVGLEFSHGTHMTALAERGAERCETCHQSTPDGVGFEPLAFDRHCARCHIKDGVMTITLKAPLKTASFALGLVQPLGTPAPELENAPRPDYRSLTLRVHRDPWLLERTGRLSAIATSDAGDPGGRQAAREQLRAYDAIVGRALNGVAPDVLRDQAQALRAELDAIDKQLSSPAAELESGARSGLAEIEALMGTSGPPAGGMTAPAPSRPTDGPDLDERRKELLALLDAIGQRGDADAQRAAAALKSRVESLAAGTGQAPVDERSTADRLLALSSIARIIEQSQPAVDADEIAALRTTVAQARREALAGSLGPDALLARQAELRQLLDAAGVNADAALARRIAGLRNAVDALSVTGTGVGALERRRAETAVQLDRVQLAIELQSEMGPTPARVTEARARLDAERRDIEAPAGASRQTTLPPLSSVTPDQARNGVQALLGGCTNCHHLDRTAFTLAPVRANLSQSSAAHFSHKPHTGQRTCESCHTQAASAATSAESLQPGVATCQTCHRSGQAAASCSTCHQFHATGAIGLRMAVHR